MFSLALLTVSSWSGLFDPISKMSNEIKKEISFRHRNHFIRNFDEQTKTFSGTKAQPLSNTEIKWIVLFTECGSKNGPYYLYINIRDQKYDHRNKFSSKGLSSSRSGDIFFNSDYNEVLKFVIFRYSISRYKCSTPNKTNFMDFCQKLWILEPLAKV